jgi:hypothetical protein
MTDWIVPKRAFLTGDTAERRDDFLKRDGQATFINQPYRRPCFSMENTP